MSPAVEGDFGVEVVDEGSGAVIRVTGELDLATSPRLQEACTTVADRKPERVEIDMAGVSFLDSTGISVLVQAHKQVDEQGGTLVLSRVTDQTRRVLDVAGLNDFFHLAEDSTS